MFIRKRYFIFSGDFQLRYFTSSALERCKGSADLTPSNVVSVDIDRTTTADEHEGFGFVILCKDRTWKFRARTARERQQWVEMLRSVVMLSTAQSTPHTFWSEIF